VPIRVLIVDDSRSYLDAACALLEREGLEVVGVASTSAAALQQARALEPDVVLVDISLGEESGFELARRLAENDPDDQAALVLISTRAEADFEDLIAESPAVGFLAKADLSADALRAILDGRSR
jgi:DNA-binding NarL/FixJ family response regulator